MALWRGKHVKKFSQVWLCSHHNQWPNQFNILFSLKVSIGSMSSYHVVEVSPQMHQVKR